MFVLRENGFPVGNDIKYAASAWDQLGFNSSLLCDFGRQTGGLRRVVSLAAVSDRNFHVYPGMKRLQN